MRVGCSFSRCLGNVNDDYKIASLVQPCKLGPPSGATPLRVGLVCWLFSPFQLSVFLINAELCVSLLTNGYSKWSLFVKFDSKFFICLCFILFIVNGHNEGQVQHLPDHIGRSVRSGGPWRTEHHESQPSKYRRGAAESEKKFHPNQYRLRDAVISRPVPTNGPSADICSCSKVLRRS